jgi:hypothetical protein
METEKISGVIWNNTGECLVVRVVLTDGTTQEYLGDEARAVFAELNPK